MRYLGRSLSWIVAALAGFYVLQAPARAVDGTHVVEATANGEFWGAYGQSLPLSSDGPIVIDARLSGGGLFQGDLTAWVTPWSDGVEPDELLVFAAVSIARPNAAVVLWNVEGMVDSATGELTLDGVVGEAYGTLAGASGPVHLHGWAAEGGAFEFDGITATLTFEQP